MAGVGLSPGTPHVVTGDKSVPRGGGDAPTLPRSPITAPAVRRATPVRSGLARVGGANRGANLPPSALKAGRHRPGRAGRFIAGSPHTPVTLAWPADRDGSATACGCGYCPHPLDGDFSATRSAGKPVRRSGYGRPKCPRGAAFFGIIRGQPGLWGDGIMPGFPALSDITI